MVHAALPEEAKVDFGKVNGTFLSLGFSTREKVENFLKNRPSFWRLFLRRNRGLGIRPLALPILISVLSFWDLSPTWLLFLPLLPCCHNLIESHFCLSFPLHRYSILLLPFQRMEWAEHGVGGALCSTQRKDLDVRVLECQLTSG